MTDLTKLRAELRASTYLWQAEEWGVDVPVDELRALLDALDAAERERDEARAADDYDRGYKEGFEEGYDLGLRKAVQEEDRAP
jgi:flagellar biosynthesis/type III secretory pathway protein FliH